MEAGTPAAPLELVVIGPGGVTLQSINSVAGLAAGTPVAIQPGTFVVQVVNLGLAPLQARTTTTPLVQR